jgi:hypothetical protein
MNAYVDTKTAQEQHAKSTRRDGVSPLQDSSRNDTHPAIFLLPHLLPNTLSVTIHTGASRLLHGKFPTVGEVDNKNIHTYKAEYQILAAPPEEL